MALSKNSTKSFLPGVITMCMLSLICNLSYAQMKAKSLLLGRWEFVKFESEGFNKEEIQKANNNNKGLVLKFSWDNTLKSEQKGGKAINNITGKYKLSADGKTIMMGDKVQIIQLDKNYLKLYSNPKKPIIVFKRI